MDKVVDSLVKLLDKYLLPMVLIIAFLLYQKFGSLFDRNKKEQQEEKKQEEEHQDDLVPDYKDPKKAKSEKERKNIILENGEEAKRYKHALYAEKIKRTTDFGISFTRPSDLMKIAGDMKLHKVSLSATAAQYKKVNHTDMYVDVRIVMGTQYTAWLALAGSVK
jgi:hypothetical protein